MKDKLKEYRTLKLELADVEDLINEKSLQDSVQGSSKDFPYIKQNHRIMGTPDEDYSLLVRKSDIKARIKEIEDFVNAIPFYQVKKAISIYFLDEIENGEDKPTWEDVADKIGHGVTAGSMKMKVRRYLKSVTNVTHVTN